MYRKEKLFEKIERSGFPEKEIAVSLEEFFEGNDDYASIGPNLYPNQPSPQEFYKKFKELKQLKQADDILVRISDIEGLDWPYTDTVYIISDLPMPALKTKLKDLQADKINEGWMYGKPVNAKEPKKGLKVYSILWD